MMYARIVCVHRNLMWEEGMNTKPQIYYNNTILELCLFIIDSIELSRTSGVVGGGGGVGVGGYAVPFWKIYGGTLSTFEI